MRKLNMSVPVKYIDRNGDTKTKWVNIGGLVINDDGKVFGNIDAVPTDKNWDGSISCFDREDKPQQHQNQTQQHPQGYGQQQNYQAPQQQQVQQGQPQQNQVPTYHVDKDGNPLPQ